MAEVITDGGAPTLTCLHEAPIVAFPTSDIVGCINSAGGHAVPGNSVQDAMAHQLIPMLAHSLRGEGFDASEDGMGRGTPLVPVAFAIQAGALRTNPASGPDGVGVQADHAYTIEARAEVQAVAFAHQAGGIQTTLGYDPEAGTAPTLAKCQTPAVHSGMAVRRLTPRECERLQGFPDDYTLIPWRTWQESARKGASYEGLLLDRGMTLRGPSNEDCPDGPRYKALGNSWATPCARWIGERIQEQVG